MEYYFYNFNIHYFLQAFPDWFYKELTNEEKKIFYILDNAKNESHNTLKELSNINNYNKFLDILNRCSSENNLKFTDLNNDLKNDQNSKKWLFVDRVHMTDFGYKFLSKLILNKI